MIQHHKWSLTELEDMMPYERDIYVELLKNWVQEENERIKQQNQSQVKMAIIDKQSAQEEVEQDLKKRRAEIAKDISEILEQQK